MTIGYKVVIFYISGLSVLLWCHVMLLWCHVMLLCYYAVHADLLPVHACAPGKVSQAPAGQTRLPCPHPLSQRIRNVVFALLCPCSLGCRLWSDGSLPLPTPHSLLPTPYSLPPVPAPHTDNSLPHKWSHIWQEGKVCFITLWNSNSFSN